MYPKRLILLFCFCFGILTAQTEQLAESYFETGTFKKAVVLYKDLYKKNPHRSFFLKRIVICLQELEEYKKVETLLKFEIRKHSDLPELLVILGYNYQLQNKEEKAITYYQKAVLLVERQVWYAYSLGQEFEEKGLPEYAIQVYEKAMETNTNYNFLYPLAKLYGEKNEIKKMLETYVDYIEKSPKSLQVVIRILTPFLEKSSDNTNDLKKYILTKNRKKPDTIWNLFLAELFKIQKQYLKSYYQYQAVYLKTGDQTSLKKILQLTKNAHREENITIEKEILQNLTTTLDHQISLIANLELIDIAIYEEKPIKEIDIAFLALDAKYTLPHEKYLHKIAYAKFLAYQCHNIDKGISVLNEVLKLPINNFQEYETKLLKGDFYLKKQAFSRALIQYALVEELSLSTELQKLALYKSALASYYKGDFDWAEIQLNILKDSADQLTANDALRLKLFIEDNKPQDSIPTGLDIYAQADYFNTIGQYLEAIDLLNSILTDYKGTNIEDDALYLQAQIFEKTKQFSNAKENYSKIITYYFKGVLIDDAWYKLSVIYRKHLPNIEQEKRCYETLMFNFPDSIYFIEARDRYKELRERL